MRKNFLCLLMIFTLLLTALIACDETQNDIDTTTENTVGSTENIIESSASTDVVLNYDDIITMYKQIVNLYPTYTEAKMLSNQCDGIDAIHNEETKELYKKLFISGYRFYLEEYACEYQEDGRNYFGYTITDLNQNGSEELILLTDLYDIIAVFSMEENQPKLLLDNYERNYYCRIDEQGRIYVQNIDRSQDTLYTQIYSLNEYDVLNLEEEYFCIDYNNLNDKQCYAMINGEKTQISESKWEELSHGWVYGYTAGIITKTNSRFDFIRLFGELNLYLPDIFTWEWSSFQFYTNENTLHISNLTDSAVSISLYDVYSIYHHKVSVKAALNGNIATFDTEEISGRLEFGLDSIWLIIDESNISGVPCGTFLYTKVGYSKG